MYGEVFCKVYNELGWNYYPEAFGEELLRWLEQEQRSVKTAMDLACGTGILCRILHEQGIEASGMDFSAGMIAIARENSPGIHYDVADMITYRPDKQFDLVTCTGDAINHIPDLRDVEKIFQNVYAYLSPGGRFVFDILNENEASAGDPFEVEFNGQLIWFQMTKPTPKTVNLQIKAFENGVELFEENIRETIHDPAVICDLLKKCGFIIHRCADRLLDDNSNHSTTWYIIAGKE